MKMVIATGNAHKLREFAEILAGSGIEVISQREAGFDLDVEETGATFEENAFIKAEAVMRATGLPAIADDSGIEADALGGAPGVYSARYTGNHGDSDLDRCLLLLRNLENTEQRSGRFVSAICCVFPNGDVLRARGTCEGTIAREMRGDRGFGYDPLLIPDGFQKTMGELTAEEKNEISHRGRALRAFQEELRRYNAGK